MNWCFIVLTFELFSLSATTACNVITESDLNFFIVEIPQNHPANEKLDESVRYEKRPSDNLQINFVNSTFNNYVLAKENTETGTIDFYLKDNESLHNYRLDAGIPSLEIEFYLSCSNNVDIQYTYMILIEDENLYPPVLSATQYSATLELSAMGGIRVHFGDGDGLTVTDLDFNPENSHFSVLCFDPPCHYFDFSISCLPYNKGNHFRIDSNFKSETLERFKQTEKHEDFLNFTIFVVDSSTESTTTPQKNKRNGNRNGEEPMATATVSFKINMDETFQSSLPSEKRQSSILSLEAFVATVCVALLLIGLSSFAMVYFRRRNHAAEDEIRKLTDAEISEFKNGLQNYAGRYGRSGSRGLSIDVNAPIMALPYNPAFEIPRDQLQIDETTTLGKGAFGVVYKGYVKYSNGERVTVAIKSVRRNVSVLYFKALLSEIKIMGSIGKHPNIVSLVGACTHDIRKREVYVAIEYCYNGNFRDYLKCRRDSFCSQIVNGKVQLPTEQSYAFLPKSICTSDLLKWSIQIASGLQYLESINVIHGDLATRNILIDEYKTAKIGDFGLSKRLIEHDNYYTKSSEAPTPWKWMAPESLSLRKFSIKSDMYSFGIVLWEIFSLGQVPYPGLTWSENFVGLLEGGMRPSKPSYATNELYEIMDDCWDFNPHDRPCILDVKRQIENMMEGTLGYIRLLEEHQCINPLNEDVQGYLVPNEPQSNNDRNA